MLVLPRLPIERQRNVGAALEDIFKTKTDYDLDVVKNAKAVIAATASLKAPTGPSMFVVDTAADSVVTAIYRILDALEKGLTDTVIALDAEQQAVLTAVYLLRDAWFPTGIGFIHDAVGLQCDALLEIRKTLNDAEIRKAIKTLGLGPLVNHLSAHTALYAKTLGLTADGEASAPEEAASENWHKAYLRFAASVTLRYENDAKTRSTLLGSYEKQLREHRTAMQKERRQRAKVKEADKGTKDDS